MKPVQTQALATLMIMYIVFHRTLPKDSDVISIWNSMLCFTVRGIKELY